MTMTLYAALNTIPELTGRIFRGVAPATPASPYAILEDRQGGVAQAYYAGADTVIVYPCVTLYSKPTAGQTPADALLALQLLVNKVQQAHHYFDTHSDGVTPYLPGSVNRAGEFPPMVDPATQGQFYVTVRFSALLLRP